MDDTTAAIEQIAGTDNGLSKQEEVDIENQSEKYDISPEILEKSSTEITPNDDLSTSISGITTTPITNNETVSLNSLSDEKTKQIDDKSELKNKATGFAFTIDFNEGKSVDNRKFKEIAERFQHRQQQQQEQRRHRRGVSLSKLDDSRKSTTSLNHVENGPSATVDDSHISAMASKPPFKQRAKPDDARTEEKCDSKVVLRKPRPSAQILSSRDSSKRHSWSPRSSLNYEKTPQMPQDQAPKDETTKTTTENTNTGGFQPKSSILQRAMESNSIRPPLKSASKVKPSITLDGKTMKDHVVTTPLEYIRNSDDEGSIGDASQATYTLDGDNYTEEEKERMSIDKMGKKHFDLSIDSRSRNTLQVNKFARDTKIEPKHQRRCSADREQLTSKTSSTTTATTKSAKSYLDKIKSRVRTIGDRTFNKSNNKAASTNEKLMNLQVVRTDDSSPVDEDHGVFTSITACGVLNRPQKENNASSVYSTNGMRRQNLTKFELDSSEYIQPKVDESLMSSYTDYEKAKQNEYKLNIFSTISSYTSSGASPPQTDEDNLSVECIDEKPISIKTAPTKNDWIQQWAKNARRRNHLLASSATASPKMQSFSKTGSGRPKPPYLQDDDRMSQSYDTYFKHGEQFGDDVIEDSSDECVTHHASRQIVSNRTKTEFGDQKSVPAVSGLRPPISPTKIPSPMHSHLRARSSSANRSFRNSNADLENLDTEMYLEKTAAAISSLQKIHRKNNSPQSPLSPMRKTIPSEIGTESTLTARNNYEKSINLRPVHVHKRNLSLDISHNASKGKTHEFYNSNEKFNKQHIRHGSYENKQIQLSSPKHSDIDQTMSRGTLNEQQRMFNKYFADSERNEEHARRASCGTVGDSSGSPIRRSSSFCNRNIVNILPTKATTPTASKKPMNRRITMTGSNSLQKSASSSSFKKLAAANVAVNKAASYSQHYGPSENETYYINGRDNLHSNRDELLYSSDESDEANSTTGQSGRYDSDRQSSDPPISHTRYNKAFLMRMEQNKQIAGGNKGVVACPNTPELPRRATNQRASFRDPTSMPRDSSLSRMKQDLPNLQTTKKALTQAVSKDSSSSSSSVKQRVLPKYLDISKYKPVQGQNFLKRDESKSTLINRTEIRKSPSAIGLSKGDPMRASGRVKSAGAKPNTPVNAKETKAREAELAMWRRRATYDPMKAAAEGRKKQEEAKKSAQSSSKIIDSSVLRSQSFHNGVGQFNNLQLRQQFSEDSFNKNCWTVMSTESSDEEEFGDHA